MKYLKLLLIILFISCSPEKSSDLKLMDLFSNGMVLQQKSKTKIWGVSNANATINLESSWGVKSSTEADANGNWITEIDTPKAGGPYSMKITDGIKTEKIKDILFSKSAEKVDAFKPQVATNSFNAQEPEAEVEPEVENSPEEVPAEE